MTVYYTVRRDSSAQKNALMDVDESNSELSEARMAWIKHAITKSVETFLSGCMKSPLGPAPIYSQQDLYRGVPI